MSRQRVTEPDVLRGVALLGICVVNMPLLAGIDPLTPPTVSSDRVVAFVVALLFQGKFFVLFSFLFGWGVAAQQGAARREGVPFEPRFRRRLVALLAVGAIHASLVFSGDILILYALIGFVLLPLRNLASRRLLRIAAGLTVLAVPTYMALGVLLSELSAALPSAAVDAPPIETPWLGTFGDAARGRLFEWPFAFSFVLLFNGPLALAAVCAGLAAGRFDALSHGAPAYAALRRHWRALLATGLASNALYALAVDGAFGEGGAALLGFSMLAVGSPSLAVVYLVATVEFVRRYGVACASVAAAGRMSLSAYVAQGVVAGLLFNGYGLGWYGTVGDLACLAVSAGVYASVVVGCASWSKIVGRGPLETAVRAFSHRRLHR